MKITVIPPKTLLTKKKENNLDKQYKYIMTHIVTISWATVVNGAKSWRLVAMVK